MGKTQEELKKALKNTYAKASKILLESETTSSASISNTDIDRLNKEAQSAMDAYAKVTEKYNAFIKRDYLIAENLIGLTCGRYYMSLARRYLKKVQKTISILHALNSGSKTLYDYINEIENLIMAYRLDPASFTLEELKARLQEILALLGLLNDNVMSELRGYEQSIDSDGNSTIVENVSLNGSTYSYETWRSSYLASFQDTGSVHGDSTEAGAIISLISDIGANGLSDDYAYLTWPSKKIHNLKMKFVQDHLFLWIYKSYYIGIYDPEDDDEDSVAIRVKAKTTWLGKKIQEEPKTKGFEIATGYRVEAIYTEVTRSSVTEENYDQFFVKATIKKNKKAGISEDTDVYTRAQEYDASEQHYYKRTRKTIENVKPDDLLSKNNLNEEYEITTYKSKNVKELSVDNIQHTKTVIVLDEETYDPNNADKIADSATVYIYDVVNSNSMELVYQMDMNASNDNDDVYAFKSNLTKPEDEDSKSNTSTIGSTTNTTIASNADIDIPVIMTISKNRYYDSGTRKFSSVIEFRVDDSQSTAFTDINQYKPIEYLMSTTDKELSHQKTTVVDLRTVLRERPNAAVASSLNDILSIDVTDADTDFDEILDLLNNALLTIKEMELKYLKQIRAYMVKGGKAFNTFTLGENIRKSIDSYYDSSIYDNIMSSYETHYSDLNSYSDLSLNAILDKIEDDSISNLISEVNETSNTLDETIIDNLNALMVIRKIENHYEPLFGHNYIDNTITMTGLSLNTAITVYTGEQLYSSMYNYAEEMFIYMNIYGYGFASWLQALEGYTIVSDRMLIVYYMISKLMINSCLDGIDVIDKFKPYMSLILLDMIRNGDIPASEISSKVKDVLNKENDLYDNYGIVVDDDINAGKIPLLLIDDNKYLNKINQIDLRKLFEVSGNSVYESKHYIALTTLLYKAMYSSDMDSTIQKLSKYLREFLNFRTMLVIKEYNKVLDKMSLSKDTYSNFRIYPDEISNLINAYYYIYDYYYGEDAHSLYDDAIKESSSLYKLLH